MVLMRRPIGAVPSGTLLIGFLLNPDMNVGATLFGPSAAGPGLGDIQESGIYECNACYRDYYLEAMTCICRIMTNWPVFHRL